MALFHLVVTFLSFIKPAFIHLPHVYKSSFSLFPQLLFYLPQTLTFYLPGLYKHMNHGALVKMQILVSVNLSWFLRCKLLDDADTASLVPTNASPPSRSAFRSQNCFSEMEI